MQKISKLTLAVFLIAPSFNTFAQMHKCVINGKTSYTEKQCPTPTSEKAITKGTASVLDTSAIRKQIMEDEIKKQIQKKQQLLQQQQAPQQQAPQQAHEDSIRKCKIELMQSERRYRGSMGQSMSDIDSFVQEKCGK